MRCCVALRVQSKAAAIVIDYKLFESSADRGKASASTVGKLGALLRRESASNTLKRRELKCTFA